MAVVIELRNKTYTLEDGIFVGTDPVQSALFNRWAEMRPLKPGYHPFPDADTAEAFIETFGGRIVESIPPDYEPNVFH